MNGKRQYIIAFFVIITIVSFFSASMYTLLEEEAADCNIYVEQLEACKNICIDDGYSINISGFGVEYG